MILSQTAGLPSNNYCIETGTNILWFQETFDLFYKDFLRKKGPRIMTVQSFLGSYIECPELSLLFGIKVRWHKIIKWLSV